MAKIRNGERGLTSQAAWRLELKRSKRARDLVDSVASLSSNILKGMLYRESATRNAYRNYGNTHIL